VAFTGAIAVFRKAVLLVVIGIVGGLKIRENTIVLIVIPE